MQLSLIKKCPLFESFTDAELDTLFALLDPIERSYVKGEVILAEGDTNYYFRIMLCGSATVCKPSVDSGRDVYTSLKTGSVFGDVIAVSGGMRSEVSVTATESCRCLLLDYRKIIDPAFDNAHLRSKLLANMTKDLAYKYFALRDRIDCITCGTLREKILTYLRINTSAAQGNTVYVPLSRDQLASYLNADRASLCRELSRMQKDGLIQYYKSSFRLLQ